MRALNTLALVLFFAAGTVAAFSQSSDLTNGANLAQQGKWKESVVAYRSALESNDRDGAAWMGLGEAQLQLSKYADAKVSFGKAVSLGYRPLLNRVNVARVAAKEGDTAEVYADLRALVNDGLGGTVRPIVLNSPEFAAMLGTDEFREFTKTELVPCHTRVFHEFDFWVGSWKVMDPQGNVVGENLVTSEQDGCLIVEHWKAASGAQTGSSFNYYDIRDKKWHQLYIDNSGNAGAFPAMAGALENGKMVLLTDAAAKPLSRWTWYQLSANRVRQMAEVSLDEGKTWHITWDSVYEKK